MNEQRHPVLNGKTCMSCHLSVLVCPKQVIVSSGRRFSRPAAK